MLTFGSLFAGIGGFDLGLERAGMSCSWQVEREPYAVRVLEKHWPNVRRHDDVCTFPPAEGDWSVDLICGGFPCQDISVAGKGLGLAGARSGLWHEMHRIISEIRPRFVLVENVAALLGRGMATVLGDLSEIGYDAEWHVIPASAVGAPHRRDRVWIVAHADCAGTVSIAGTAEGCGRTDAGFRLPPLRQTHRQACANRAVAASGVASDVAHTNCGCLHRSCTDTRDGRAIQDEGTQRELCGGNGCKDVADAAHSDDSKSGYQKWRPPMQSRGGCGRSGTCHDWWASEPDVCGMVDGVSRGLDGGLNDVNGRRISVSCEEVARGLLRKVWIEREPSGTSQRRKSSEQFAREYPNLVWCLSHEAPLAERQGALAEARYALHRLREAYDSRALRDAPESLEAAWQSLPCETQDWFCVAAGGRTYWQAGEWPSVGRVATGVPSRVDRLRGLGNAVVPQIVELIGRRIIEHAARQDAG